MGFLGGGESQKQLTFLGLILQKPNAQEKHHHIWSLIADQCRNQ